MVWSFLEVNDPYIVVNDVSTGGEEFSVFPHNNCPLFFLFFLCISVLEFSMDAFSSSLGFPFPHLGF